MSDTKHLAGWASHNEVQSMCKAVSVIMPDDSIADDEESATCPACLRVALAAERALTKQAHAKFDALIAATPSEREETVARIRARRARVAAIVPMFPRV